MKILVIGKGPPIQGGASNCTYGTAVDLVNAGHDVELLTDAQEVEASMRLYGVNILSSSRQMKLPRMLSPSAIGNYEHFPKSTLRTERLLGKAIEILSNSHYDLVVGWYLIPYGFVAYAASVATGVPYALVHGGSDLMTLAKHSDISRVIRLILKRAEFIVTAQSVFVQKRLLSVGGKDLKIRTMKQGLPLAPYHYRALPGSFGADNVGGIFDHYRKEVDDGVLLDAFKSVCKWNDSSGPTIIMYGKASRGKRTFSTIRSLSILAERGYVFRFICLLSGSRENVLCALSLFRASIPLLNRSIVLPGVHSAIIPSILREGDIGLCLEEGFGVPNHLSVVPREIMNSGLVCVVSNYMVSQPFYKWILKDKLNVIATGEDDFSDSIVKLIQNPELMVKFKAASRLTSKYVEQELSGCNPAAEALVDGNHVRVLKLETF